MNLVGYFGVLIDTEGSTYTWGSNDLGERGVGDCKPRQSITMILKDKIATSVSCGMTFAIALGKTVNNYKLEQMNMEKEKEKKEGNRLMNELECTEDKCKMLNKDKENIKINIEKVKTSISIFEGTKQMRKLRVIELKRLVNENEGKLNYETNETKLLEARKLDNIRRLNENIKEMENICEELKEDNSQILNQ